MVLCLNPFSLNLTKKMSFQTFTYNPRTDAYEHPKYRSISKTTLLEKVESVLRSGAECDGEDGRQDVESVIRDVLDLQQPEEPISVLQHILSIYAKTIGRKMTLDFPAIEILTLVAERYEGLIELLWGYGQRKSLLVSQTLSTFTFSKEVKLPIYGHILFSPEKDVVQRFHLVLMMGFDPTEIYYYMSVCRRYIHTVGKPKFKPVEVYDVDRNFVVVCSLMFDMGLKPCDILKSNISKRPLFDRPFAELYSVVWRDHKLPEDKDAGLGPCISGWCTSCGVYNNSNYVDDEMLHDRYVCHVMSQTLFDKLQSRLFPILKSD